MSVFDKCNSCNLYHNCDYLNRGEVCNKGFHVTSYEEEFSLVNGKPMQIELNSRDSDVRLDLIVQKKNVLKLWGQVKDQHGAGVKSAMVTLLKPQYVRGNIEYYPVKTTFSDCFGFYYFEIERLEKGLSYFVSVSK